MGGATPTRRSADDGSRNYLNFKNYYYYYYYYNNNNYYYYYYYYSTTTTRCHLQSLKTTSITSASYLQSSVHPGTSVQQVTQRDSCVQT